MVVVCDASKDAEASVRKMLGRIDGIVIANDTISDTMVRQIVRTTPTVLVARDAIEGCDAVQVENFISSAELTRHLLDHGRTGSSSSATRTPRTTSRSATAASSTP